MQAEVAEVNDVTLIRTLKHKECRLRMRMHRVKVEVMIVVAVDVFSADGAPRGGGHQIRFCKMEVCK